MLLEDGSRSVFYYVQLLHCRQLQQRPTDKLRRVWDSPYSLVYQERGSGMGKGWSTQFVSRHMGSERLPKGDVIQYLQKKAKVCVSTCTYILRDVMRVLSLAALMYCWLRPVFWVRGLWPNSYDCHSSITHCFVMYAGV